MSTTTDKLALFKYDPSTDGAQTFNIKQALNDNWDKLDDAVKEILITLANKAPGGYGLGELWNKAPDMDADQISATGFFVADKNTPNGNNWGIVSFNYDNESATQWGIPQNNKAFYGSVTKREKRNSAWGPWEWENPPMDLNTEYRTTERYMRKPVYAKLVNCEALPNAGYKTVSVGVSGLEKVIDVSGCAIDARNGDFYSIPATNFSSSVHNVGLYVTGIQAIAISTQSDRSSYNAYVKVKYTKTTD